MTEEMKAVADSMVRAVKEYVARALGERTAGLEARIKTLESRPVLEYRGVWKADEDYRPGDLVTHGGSLHYCWAPVRGSRPGESDSWQLCVKRGADGRDAR
jgi:hypothetical protein